MADDEKCRWHDERLSLIEGALWGQPPERRGGMLKQLNGIDAKMNELMIWVRAGVRIGTIAVVAWVLLFGGTHVKEIVTFFK
jgi:hypothetical protein